MDSLVCGHSYALREPEVATNGFSDENVIGEGGYAIVYSGVLADNRGQAEKELKVEVEAVGLFRLIRFQFGFVNLVDWLKTMVTTGTQPSSGALKRPLLVALCCVDLRAQKRPKMGHVIHML
ncbi:putative non-specific serine/threonine protein kinase [Helianthus annuus]|nr:putative non-specific serine/threonine protein kinase [Helianthus annuus]